MIKDKNQEIRDKAEALLKRFFASWPFNPLPDDYGLDFFITVTENTLILEKYNFLVQLKGSESISYKKGHFAFTMDVKHLLSYLKNPIPVLLVIYDVITEVGYWINVQRYCRNILNIKSPKWIEQETKDLHIPLKNELTDNALIKQEIIESTNENTRLFVENMKWPEGYESIKDNPEEIKKVIDKSEIENIKRRIQTSILYFRTNNLREMQEQFFEIYKLKRNDVHHLQATLAIMTTSNIFTEKLSTFISLTNEGLKLSKKIGESTYELVFKFFLHYYKSFELIVKNQLPNFLKRIELKKDRSKIKDFIKLLWESDSIVLNDLLKEHNKSMSLILKELIKSKLIFEYHTLNLHLVQIEVYVNSILVNFIEKEVFSSLLESNEEIIELHVKLSEILGVPDTNLHMILLAGGYYSSYKLEKAKEYYEQGLKIAKEKKHHYYIDKFNYNIKHLNDPPVKPLKLDDIKIIPLSQTIKTLKWFKTPYLDSITDSELKKTYEIALNDLDPLEILKLCKNCIVSYYPSLYGQAEGLYSLGTKQIGCIKKKKIVESSNLHSLFILFQKEFCEDCEFNEPREKDFDPPTSIIESMRLRMNGL